MIEKNKKNKLKTKLTKKFRLVVLNEDSFEERFSFKLTRLNVFVLGGVFSIILVTLTVLLIAFTPIKEYIPGFSSTQLKRQATDLFYKVDSLQQHLSTIEKYTSAMKPILIGEEKEIDMDLPYQEKQVERDIAVVEKSINSDSIRKVVENIRHNLDSTWKTHYAQISKEQIALQKNRYDSLHNYANDTLSKLAELYNNQIFELTELNENMKLELLKNKKNISDLENSISMKKIEVKNLMNSLSKENKEDLLAINKSAEKIKAEVERREKARYKEREIKLTNSFEQERQVLNKSLFTKETIIDSLLFAIAENQQEKIGEINQLKTEVLSVKDSLLIQRSLKDSIFRESVEREDRYSLFDFETDKVDVVFFAPVKGIITDGYSVKEKHFAVDVAVTKGTAVKSIADGTVIFAEWTAETGYVMIIEHVNKYLSVYKHNEIIYRKQGDLVQTGEVISKAGSSGEYSTGPHLHFEMWYQGYPVNPTNFIEFE
ncbi:murein hydrolase activator EnvC family protein [Bacteroidota bacterium]